MWRSVPQDYHFSFYHHILRPISYQRMDRGTSFPNNSNSRAQLSPSARHVLEKGTQSGPQPDPSSSQSSNSRKMRLEFLLDSPPSHGASRSSAKHKNSQHGVSNAGFLGSVDSNNAIRNKMSIGNILNASSPTPKTHAKQSSSHEPVRDQNLIEGQSFLCSAPQCGARFGTRFQVQRHRTTVHGLESYQCIYCKTILAREANLTYHVNSKHRNVRENWCHKCSFKSKDLSAYRNHMDMVHSKKKCPKCGNKITKSFYQQHAAECATSSHAKGKR